jgi:hypothetical protein
MLAQLHDFGQLSRVAKKVPLRGYGARLRPVGSMTHGIAK